MSTDPTPHSMRDSLGNAAIGGLAALCCAGPALLAAGALGVLGSWLLNPWLIGAAVLLALGAVGLRLRHRASTSSGADGELCCPPAPDAGQSPPAPAARER